MRWDGSCPLDCGDKKRSSSLFPIILGLSPHKRLQYERERGGHRLGGGCALQLPLYLGGSLYFADGTFRKCKLVVGGRVGGQKWPAQTFSQPASCVQCLNHVSGSSSSIPGRTCVCTLCTSLDLRKTPSWESKQALKCITDVIAKKRYLPFITLKCFKAGVIRVMMMVRKVMKVMV